MHACLEKCDVKILVTDGRMDRAKTVYLPLVPSRDIINVFDRTESVGAKEETAGLQYFLFIQSLISSGSFRIEW